MRILVVDDERAVREALERAPRLEGYEVELSEDGQQALMALAGRSDAIVLDVLMPVMDGIDTCRRCGGWATGHRVDAHRAARGRRPRRRARRRR
jgi:two-component system response regulator MprA